MMWRGLYCGRLVMPDAPLWTADEFLAAVSGDLTGSFTADANGVSIDSRSLEPGDIFFAILGDRLDGHHYVRTALEAGASIAVVSRVDDDMLAAGPVLVVDDTLKAMEQLAHAARARFKGQAVAVTGSVGKTSSKEALKHCLSRQGKTHAATASFNNHWGVPLTLSRLPRDAVYGVFEVGMNHPGEITPLTKMIIPHVAIITTIEAVHIGAFSSVEEIADAKAEIFAGVAPGGVAILNADNPHFSRLKAAAESSGIGQIVSFGTQEACNSRLLDIALHNECSCITANICGHELTYRLGMPGRHMAINSLAVLAAIELLGADLAMAALALAEMSPAKGRGARLELSMSNGTATLIDESYNANPASMRAALALLGLSSPGRGGRRIAVMGDMLELGPTSIDLHAKLADDVALAQTDLVFACGDHMKALWDCLPLERQGAYAVSSDKLEAGLLAAVRSGDVIMVKGSLGSRMGPLVEALCKRYPEAEGEASPSI